jgi:type VI secretion system protein ImpA
MPVFEFAELTAPVDEAEVCGPDLDLAGDPDYLNFVAKAEGLLPASYFSSRDGKPFDRASVDFAAEFTAAKPLLERTRDLRFLIILAKFTVLNRDLASFETIVRAIAKLLEERWDDVHPRGEEGDFTSRMAALESLDDAPTVVLPLQFIPLVTHRRFGTITYRNIMIARGEVKAREEEQAPDLGTIDKALMEAELPEIVEVLRNFEGLQVCINSIRTIWIDRAGFEQAVNLEKVPAILPKIIAVLNEVVGKRDPSQVRVPEAEAVAEDEEGAPPAAVSTVASGAVRTTAEAADALAAVADYFTRCEPSNPALLLVRQAQQLIGLSFVDVLRMLVPAHVEQAMIAIGGQQVFELPVERLSTLDGSGGAANGGAEFTRQLQASTRADAFALLDQAGAFFRASEPTSPISVIIDRARKLADRDFMSLLKDLLPEKALKTIKAP